MILNRGFKMSHIAPFYSFTTCRAQRIILLSNGREDNILNIKLIP
jgi:hypothetical protein